MNDRTSLIAVVIRTEFLEWKRVALLRQSKKIPGWIRSKRIEKKTNRYGPHSLKNTLDLFCLHLLTRVSHFHVVT